MIGIHFKYLNENEHENFYPMGENASHWIDLEVINQTINSAAVSIANQLNDYISTLDTANLDSIILSLNGSNILIRNSQLNHVKNKKIGIFKVKGTSGNIQSALLKDTEIA